jgi:D-tyrosyl-tRNA(Tyr) deacylase
LKTVIQRVKQASVSVRDERVSSIGPGLLVLLGVAEDDAAGDAAFLARKLAGLRVFEDESGKMNLSLQDVHGAILAVPQFTLLGDCRKGRRPDFTAAARPEKGLELFNLFCQELERAGIPVQRGVFREHMLVSLENDGPVTLMIDSKEK